MSLLRLCLFLFFDRQGNSFHTVTQALLLGVRYDAREVSILLMLMLILGSFRLFNPFGAPYKIRCWLFVFGVTSFLLLFFYAVDFAHFGYLSQRLNASVLNYLSDSSISFKMVWESYPILKIIVLLVAGVFIMLRILRWTMLGIQSHQLIVAKYQRILWFGSTFLLLAAGIFGKLGQFPLRWSDAFGLGTDYKANLALNPFQSFFSSLKFRHNTYDMSKVRQGVAVLAPYFGFQTNQFAPSLVFQRSVIPVKSGPRSNPNIIVVICESFSGFKSSMWGNPLNTTPHFNAMSKQGIFFDHCFTPSYGTARGVWAVISGIPDVETSTTTSSRNPAAVDQHTIINDFTGYSKFYFLGGSTSWANIRGLLTNNIADLHLYEQQDYTSPKIDVWGISDKNLFLEANTVLKQQTKPFFAIIQTADNHRPYTIPQEDKKNFPLVQVSNDSLKKFGFDSNDELNAFRYTDFGFQIFMEAAKKTSYYDNTIFLFIGDHGIAGNAGTMFPNAWTDQRLSAEHVPLLIYAPKLLAPRRISNVCSQIDVLPTLAGICQIPYTNTTLGRDVLDSTAISNKQFSFIYDPDQAYIGLIKGDFFFREQITSGKQEIVSMLNNLPAPADVQESTMKNQMQLLTEGMFEVSKYLIVHNKKIRNKQ